MLNKDKVSWIPGELVCPPASEDSEVIATMGNSAVVFVTESDMLKVISIVDVGIFNMMEVEESDRENYY